MDLVGFEVKNLDQKRSWRL